MAYRGHPLEIYPYSEGRDGTYLTKAKNDPDYLVQYIGKGECLIECKTSPLLKKYSNFKVDSLRAATEYNATILLFFGITTKSQNFKEETDLSKVRWCLIPPSISQALLDTYEHKPFFGMGGKICVTVPWAENDRWFDLELMTMYQ